MSNKIAGKLEQLYNSLELYGEKEAAHLIKKSFLNIFKALRRGSSGSRVREIQKTLLGKGFKLPGFGVDGVFGPETETAVKDFQQQNQLTVDGVVGEKTIAKLNPSVITTQPQAEGENFLAQKDRVRVLYSTKRYEPFSRRAMRLFREAAVIAGVPQEWASSQSLHSILQKESDGWTGYPNYTYGSRAADPSYWGQIHEELRAGEKTAESSATGLGQLLLRNVDKYYPSGRNGIGDPKEEAVGMLRYIKDRYKSPEEAWSMYGSVPKKDPETGAVFTEGY